MIENNNRKDFSFTGTATEFFGIWIVNILLTILTLGFYTPWAKVRTNRYFYGHTHVAGFNFDYLASPITILKGYLIAVALFIIYIVVSTFAPGSEIIFFLLLMIALPFIVVRAMAFRLRNTAYRNLRFRFDRQYAQAAWVYLGIGILIPLTLGLIFPYFSYRTNKFLIANAGYGRSRFSFESGAGAFYKIYLIALGILIGVGIVVAIVMMPVMMQMQTAMEQAAQSGVEPDPAAMGAAMAGMPVLIYFLVLLLYFGVFIYIRTAIANLVWNNVTLDGRHKFESSLKLGRMAWIIFSNMVVIALSLGLMIPWSRVRMVRYRMNTLCLIPEGDLDTFIAAKAEEESALGEEMGDVFDMDIGGIG